MNTQSLAPQGAPVGARPRSSMGVSVAALLVLLATGAFFAIQACSGAPPGQAADPGGATKPTTTPPTPSTPSTTPTTPTTPNNNPPPPT